MNVAIIPARGGSKRIPQKNIRPFLDKPLIGYSIEAAKNSGLFDRIIVSTDCPQVAAVAEGFGAEVPFTRPDPLADDFAPMSQVIDHALQWLQEQGINPDFVCGLFATAPLLAVDDLRTGLDILKQSPSVRGTLAVTSFPFPVQRALRVTEAGVVEMMQPEHELTRSQDLEPAYHDAGQFFWRCMGDVDIEAARPVFVDRYRVQDIDTEEDWAVAELQYRLLEQMNSGR